MTKDEMYLDILEKRLANTERALFAFWVLLKDTMPPQYESMIDKMISEYFDANIELGADFLLGPEGFELTVPEEQAKLLEENDGYADRMELQQVK